MKDFLKNKQKWIVGLVSLGLMFVADSNNVNYRYHNGNILKYSRSGISEINTTAAVF